MNATIEIFASNKSIKWGAQHSYDIFLVTLFYLTLTLSIACYKGQTCMSRPFSSFLGKPFDKVWVRSV